MPDIRRDPLERALSKDGFRNEAGVYAPVVSLTTRTQAREREMQRDAILEVPFDVVESAHYRDAKSVRLDDLHTLTPMRTMESLMPVNMRPRAALFYDVNKNVQFRDEERYDQSRSRPPVDVIDVSADATFAVAFRDEHGAIANQVHIACDPVDVSGTARAETGYLERVEGTVDAKLIDIEHAPLFAGIEVNERDRVTMHPDEHRLLDREELAHAPVAESRFRERIASRDEVHRVDRVERSGASNAETTFTTEPQGEARFLTKNRNDRSVASNVETTFTTEPRAEPEFLTKNRIETQGIAMPIVFLTVNEHTKPDGSFFVPCPTSISASGGKTVRFADEFPERGDATAHQQQRPTIAAQAKGDSRFRSTDDSTPEFHREHRLERSTFATAHGQDLVDEQFVPHYQERRSHLMPTLAHLENIASSVSPEALPFEAPCGFSAGRARLSGGDSNARPCTFSSTGKLLSVPSVALRL